MNLSKFAVRQSPFLIGAGMQGGGFVPCRVQAGAPPARTTSPTLARINTVPIAAVPR